LATISGWRFRELALLTCLGLAGSCGGDTPLPEVSGPPERGSKDASFPVGRGDLTIGLATTPTHPVPYVTESAVSVAPSIDYCELMTPPATHAGQLIKVRGSYLANFELSFLADYSCFDERPQTWVQFHRSSIARLSPPTMLKTIDNAQAQDGPVLDVTFVGFFEGEGRDRTRFGHLGAFGFQLIVVSIEKAVEHPGRPR
jgi:hypothetical protein